MEHVQELATYNLRLMLLLLLSLLLELLLKPILLLLKATLLKLY